MPSIRLSREPHALVLGLSLIASPLAGLVGSLLLPAYTGGMQGELAFIAAHPTRWLAGMSADLLFSLLLIPAALGLAWVLRPRAPVLGPLCGGMLLVAAFVHGAMLGYQLPEASLVAHGGDRAAMVALSEAMYGDPAFMLLVIPFTALCFPGLLLAAAALWRTRVVPRWVPPVLAAAVAVELLGPPALKARLFFALLLLSLGRLGVQLLRTPAGPLPDVGERYGGEPREAREAARFPAGAGR